MTPIGQRIKERRTELGLSRSALARQAKLSRATLWTVENGKGLPSWQTLEKVAVALRISLEVLAHGSEYAASDEVIPGELAKMADECGLAFTEAYCLLRVAKTLEQSSSQFQLRPVAWDWRLLYERVKEWL